MDLAHFRRYGSNPPEKKGKTRVADIFREVDEAVRQDRVQALWQKYGTYAIAAVVVIVLAAGGFSGWREYRADQHRAAGDSFATADLLLSQGQAADAAAMYLAIAADDVAAYGELARARAAQALVEAGRRDEAVALLDALAADAGAEPFLRDVARLSAVALQLDDGDPAGLAARLEPLLREGSGLLASARELSGLIALRSGETATAIEIFRLLASDPTTIPGVRLRAERILATLGAAGQTP
ncbi:MAG: tetratricopeptide repeat protein [Alphaproteobacteria bacterium]|nr:tetratricopeptide repeat protein [Alphaproteobacteria bacterium]